MFCTGVLLDCVVTNTGLWYYLRMTLRNHIKQDATLSIRLYGTELEAIKKGAQKAGKTLAEAVREVMLKWAAKQ